MTPRAIAVVLGLAVGLALLKAQTPPASPQQTFRVGTDVVMVDVSVKSGDRVLTGLGPEDFVLTDNGVRQRIESVEATAVPIDLTLVVDLSGNPARPWMSRVDPAGVAASVEKEAREVSKILRPTDRVRLLAIDRYVQQIWPLDVGTAQRPIHRIEFDGLGSVYDTLAAALMHPVEPARRHVVMARTKGVDTISAISARALRAIADRSDALFHLVIMETAIENDVSLSAFQSNFIGLVEPTNRSWRPHRRQLVSPGIPHSVLSDGVALKAGLETTGGRWHQATGVSVPSLTGTFRETFENFRQGYMLRYVPQGVTRTGWHTIHVTVPSAKGYTVRARTGYGIEDSTPAPVATAVPAAPKTLAELTLAYEAGAFVNVVTALRQAADPQRLMRDFEEEGNPWPAAPRREAAFAIDLTEASVFSPRAETRDRAVRLLERFTRLVRHPLEPDEFEHRWHYAVVTLLQGTIRPADIETFADRALVRFPDDPRFLLARAIAADQRSTTTGASRAGTVSAQSSLQGVRQQYEALVTNPDVGAEARIRLAWVLHRMGRSGDGLAQIEEADIDSADASLRYLRHLLSGHLLVALRRPDEAVVAYRTARAIVPTAQSSQVALMNGLLHRGDRTGAEALAEQIQTAKSTELDPWWMYWQGQYRLYGQAMARVREMGR